jgi:hypothetical protein
VQSKQELQDDTFIVVGWKAPLIGSARIYTVLAETGRGETMWDQKAMKDLYESFRGRFREYTKPIEESWSLGNNTSIKLIIGLGGDKDYCLKMTIHEDESNDGDFPVQIIPRR